MASGLIIHDAFEKIEEKERVKRADLYGDKMKDEGRSIFAWVNMMVTSELIFEGLL